MILTEPKNVIDRLLLPLEECLTLETAKRIVALRADAELQSEVDQLADKSNAGTLTEEERAQYGQYIQFSQFVSLLQIHARDMIDSSTSAA